MHLERSTGKSCRAFTASRAFGAAMLRWRTVDGVRILVSREHAPRLQENGEPAVGSLVTVDGIERLDGTRLGLAGGF